LSKYRILKKKLIDLETAAILPYGADSRCQGTKCGPETIIRLEKTVALVLTLFNKRCTIFLGAGADPKERTSPLLKKAMKSYLVLALKREQRRAQEKGRAFIMPEIVLAKVDAWGTIAETVAVAKELKERGITECYLVSSWYHLPRIILIWWRMGTFSVYVAIAWAMPVKNLLTEWYKLFGTILLSKKLIPNFRERKKHIAIPLPTPSEQSEMQISPT
jgi:hypothetical protein